MTAQTAVVDLNSIPAVPCPCGLSHRAFNDCDDFPGTMHLTHIVSDAKLHYHRKLTEVYTVLECSENAAIELDGDVHPVAPLTSILIRPGVRHRAIGEMTVLIVCTPKFDPNDEYFD